MRDLYSINTELMELQRVMGAYRLDLSNREEELNRLKRALSELTRKKVEFVDRKELCLEPDFTSVTFHGNNANDLHVFKKYELQGGFVSIPDNQISMAEDTIREEIKMTQQRIIELGNSISSLQAQHARVTAEKLEVQRNS